MVNHEKEAMMIQGRPTKPERRANYRRQSSGGRRKQDEAVGTEHLIELLRQQEKARSESMEYERELRQKLERRVEALELFRSQTAIRLAVWTGAGSTLGVGFGYLIRGWIG